MLPRDPGARLEARLWDRFYDLYVQAPLQKIVGDRLRLFFFGGVETCEGVDHVDVAYRSDAIVATLFTGRNPRAQLCIEIAVYKVITVGLDQPVRGRPIVDGSRARFGMPRSRPTNRVCSWQTRDSVTPSSLPISASVRFSR